MSTSLAGMVALAVVALTPLRVHADAVLVRDFDPTHAVVGSRPRDLLTIGDVTYFAADTPTAGVELWRSDGTAAGTYLVKDVCPGTCDGSPTDLIALGDVVLFTAVDWPGGRELWRSDGTSAGTRRVRDIYKDRAAMSYGISDARLKASDRDRSFATVRGRGARLPDPVLGDLPLPIVAQLVNREGGTCLQSVFGPGDVTRNDTRSLRARAR